jgi:hypothetical protein
MRTWWGILILGALIAVGVATLRRQSLSEFPSEAVPATAGPPADEPPAKDLAPE